MAVGLCAGMPRTGKKKQTTLALSSLCAKCDLFGNWKEGEVRKREEMEVSVAECTQMTNIAVF